MADLSGNAWFWNDRSWREAALRRMGGYGTEAGDIAILLINHDIGVVTDISDHIVVMGRG